MLNHAQQNRLRNAMGWIEERMRAIELRLTIREERGLMFHIQNNISPDMERALREKIQAVYRVIGEVQTQFELAPERKLASRDILTGLPQLWVMLQETGAKGLARYGTVDPVVALRLDPQIKLLGRLMFELVDMALGCDGPAVHSVSETGSVR